MKFLIIFGLIACTYVAANPSPQKSVKQIEMRLSPVEVAELSAPVNRKVRQFLGGGGFDVINQQSGYGGGYGGFGGPFGGLGGYGGGYSDYQQIGGYGGGLGGLGGFGFGR